MDRHRTHPPHIFGEGPSVKTMWLFDNAPPFLLRAGAATIFMAVTDLPLWWSVPAFIGMGAFFAAANGWEKGVKTNRRYNLEESSR